MMLVTKKILLVRIKNYLCNDAAKVVFYCQTLSTKPNYLLPPLELWLPPLELWLPPPELRPPEL